jgi:hypothetical protein
MTLGVKTRRAGILAPFGNVAHIDVPQVDERIRHADEFHAVLFDLHSAVAVQGVHGETGGDGAIMAHGAPHFFQRLEPEARTVLERSAVLVLALVVVRGEELQGQIGMRAVHVDDVEAGLARAQCRIDIVLLDHIDIVEVHFLAIGEGLEFRRVLAGSAGRGARFHAGCMGGAVPQFDAGQGAELVDMIGHGT